MAAFRPSGGALPGLLALSLFAAPALGQLDPVALSMSVDAADAELAPGESATFSITLENAGVLDGTALLTVDGSATGWTAALSAEEVALASGASETLTLTVTAPALRDGAPTGIALGVAGVLTDSTGQFSSSADVAVAGRLSAPPPPEPFPWAAVSAGVGAVVLAGMVATVFVAIRRRESGIEVLVPPGNTAVRAGYDAFVPAEVRNVSGRPRVAKVHVEDVPPGWAVGTNLASIPMEPGAAVSIWVSVRPPVEATPADVQVRLVARPAESKRPRPGAVIGVRIVSDGVPEDRPGRDLSVPIHLRAAP